MFSCNVHKRCHHEAGHGPATSEVWRSARRKWPPNSKVSQLLEPLAIAIYINLLYIISKATRLIDRLPGWLPLPFRFNMLQWYSDHSGCPYSLGVLQARHLSMQATVKASPFGIGVWDATIDVTWVPGCLQVVQMLPWQFSVFMLLSRGTIW